MITKSESKCPLCGERLIPCELRDGTVKFICTSENCKAIIEFGPIAFGQPVPQAVAFERIQKRAG